MSFYSLFRCFKRHCRHFQVLAQTAESRNLKSGSIFESAVPYTIPTTIRLRKRLRLLQVHIPMTISSGTNGCTFHLGHLYSVLPQRSIHTNNLLLAKAPQPTSKNHNKCWKCGRNLDTLKELFFCECGIVQAPAAHATYFMLFNIAESFDVNEKDLSDAYKDLQKQLHPDVYSQKSETEQSLAEQQSSLLNKAYSTLLKPLPRALYLLKLHGILIQEDNNDIQPDFLMDVLELNERIAESSMQDIVKIEAEIGGKIQECVKRLSQFFQEEDLQAAKAMAIKLRYYTNVELNVKKFYWRQM